MIRVSAGAPVLHVIPLFLSWFADAFYSSLSNKEAPKTIFKH